MKKVGILLFVVLLMAGLISSCSSVNNKDEQTSYTISYELGDLLEDFIELPAKAKAGETVEIKTVVLCDADLHVYVDGEEIAKSHYDSDYWGYSFTMPVHDVTVTCRPYTKAEIWGTE
ncbi:MAG: hypothetical protein IJR88_02510 [Clostridia bacterium]|nr:hypothetical protein [Clostridia bacterium]